MDDLDNFISERERSLNTQICNNLSSWLEYVTDVSIEEKEVILNEIHESLGEMSVWESDHNEQNEIIAKCISTLLILRYGRSY